MYSRGIQHAAPILTAHGNRTRQKTSGRKFPLEDELMLHFDGKNSCNPKSWIALEYCKVICRGLNQIPGWDACPFKYPCLTQDWKPCGETKWMTLGGMY